MLFSVFMLVFIFTQTKTFSRQIEQELFNVVTVTFYSSYFGANRCTGRTEGHLTCKINFQKSRLSGRRHSGTLTVSVLNYSLCRGGRVAAVGKTEEDEVKVS